MRRQLFSHYSEVPEAWMSIAPNFSFAGDPRMASRDDGSFLYDPMTLIKMQIFRDIIDAPLGVNSWYRTPLYNATLPGASPISQHIEGRAVDVSTRGHDRMTVYRAAQDAGWSSFGFYINFLHVGTSNRRWFGSQAAKKLWLSLFMDSPEMEL